MRLNFHWRLARPGLSSASSAVAERAPLESTLPRFDEQEAFCRGASRGGIKSVSIDLHPAEPEPVVLALGLARVTDRVQFMVEGRPGLMSPTLFVQQVNTFSTLASGRISIRIKAGHSAREREAFGDHIDQDDQHPRIREWLGLCRALWKREGPVSFSGRFFHVEEARLNTPFVAPDRFRPVIYVDGDSPEAREIAVSDADCWVRSADTPVAIRAEAGPLGEAGIEMGLRLSILCRPRRDDAVREARALGGQEWHTLYLWKGMGGRDDDRDIGLIGSPSDVAAGLLEFAESGVTHFLLSADRDREELRRFGRDVWPLIRATGGDHDD